MENSVENSVEQSVEDNTEQANSAERVNMHRWFNIKTTKGIGILFIIVAIITSVIFLIMAIAAANSYSDGGSVFYLALAFTVFLLGLGIGGVLMGLSSIITSLYIANEQRSRLLQEMGIDQEFYANDRSNSRVF